ncbi:hypothetical protein BHM03_00014091, partial [Ensete ventricosum]
MRRCLVPAPGRRGVVVPFSFLASSPRAGRRKLIDEESPMGDGSRGRFFALKQQIARGTREDQKLPRGAWREKPSASNDEKVGVDGKKSSSSLEEPKEFNRFMLEICKKFKRCDLADFLELLYSKKIALISKSEAAD